jgi:protein SCO1/2
MNNILKTPFLIAVAVVIFLGGAYYYATLNKAGRPLLPFYGKNITIQPSEFFAFNEALIHHAQPSSYKNQLGESVGKNSWQGKICVVNYIFTTCPGICKDMTRELRRVYQHFESNPQVVIVSHTSKPEEDSVKVLYEYALRQGVKKHAQWQFLTGDIDSLYQDAPNDYLIVNAEENRDESTFVHTERVALIDAQFHIRGFYDATNSTEVDKLIVDIEKLLSEKL